MATSRPSVFVGSSTEGLAIAKALQRGLAHEADIDVWNQATFDLSSVTMDALEERCRTADFAVFVLTPDDLKLKREKQTAAARDNVIFELGLFAGVLGRQRCFMVYEEERPIDIPSDLAGITPAKFRRYASGDLDASLGAVCSRIEKAMDKLKPRRKLSAEELSAAAALDEFCARLTGYWWQRILPDDASALSFVRVEPNPALNSVRMSGVAYHTDGTPIANWYSLGVSIDREGRQLSYIWEGLHPLQPNDSYQGFGSIKFDDASEVFRVGRGHFFNANLADLKTARRKSLEFRRCTDADEIAVMSGGGEPIGPLVLKKLKSW